MHWSRDLWSALSCWIDSSAFLSFVRHYYRLFYRPKFYYSINKNELFLLRPLKDQTEKYRTSTFRKLEKVKGKFAGKWMRLRMTLSVNDPGLKRHRQLLSVLVLKSSKSFLGENRSSTDLEHLAPNHILDDIKEDFEWMYPKCYPVIESICVYWVLLNFFFLLLCSMWQQYMTMDCSTLAQRQLNHADRNSAAQGGWVVRALSVSSWMRWPIAPQRQM